MKDSPRFCPECNKEITSKEGKSSLWYLTLHLTKHTKTELAFVITDMLVNPKEYQKKD